MNPISNKINTGTVGELLVQIRLLQHGVQAAPPIKDSGNDLIAVNSDIFRAVSVRTTTNGRFNKPDPARAYHVLAIVELLGEDSKIYLDASRIFLVPQAEVAGISIMCAALERYLWSDDLVTELFGERQDQ